MGTFMSAYLPCTQHTSPDFSFENSLHRRFVCTALIWIAKYPCINSSINFLRLYNSAHILSRLHRNQSTPNLLTKMWFLIEVIYKIKKTRQISTSILNTVEYEWNSEYPVSDTCVLPRWDWNEDIRKRAGKGPLRYSNQNRMTPEGREYNCESSLEMPQATVDRCSMQQLKPCDRFWVAVHGRGLFIDCKNTCRRSDTSKI